MSDLPTKEDLLPLAREVVSRLRENDRVYDLDFLSALEGDFPTKECQDV